MRTLLLTLALACIPPAYIDARTVTASGTDTLSMPVTDLPGFTRGSVSGQAPLPPGFALPGYLNPTVGVGRFDARAISPRGERVAASGT